MTSGLYGRRSRRNQEGRKEAFAPLKCGFLGRVHWGGPGPACRSGSTADSSWRPSACHVFNADNSSPFGKPGGWRSALLLVKALLGNFYFISLRVLLHYRCNDMKAISLRRLLALPGKDEILASNPPVSTQDGGSAARSLFVLAYTGICLPALLHVKV